MTDIPTTAQTFARWRARQTFATQEEADRAYTIERDLELLEKPEHQDGKNLRAAVMKNLTRFVEAQS